MKTINITFDTLPPEHKAALTTKGFIETFFDPKDAIAFINTLEQQNYFKIEEPVIQGPKMHQVNTPITSETSDGAIIFDNGRQFMKVVNSHLIVGENKSPDSRHLFAWVSIERDNLQTGDIAYRTYAQNKNPKFNLRYLVCCIVDADYIWAHNEAIDEIAKLNFGDADSSWYKLIRRPAAKINTANCSDERIISHDC